MIEVDEVTQKFSRLYHTVDDINNFLLRIRLIDDGLDTEEIETFKWQQKRFSPQEREHYKDVNNCLTDLEREYHAAINKQTQRQRQDDAVSIIFSYVAKDNYSTLPDQPPPHKRRHGNDTLKPNVNDNNELVRLMTKMMTSDVTENNKVKSEYDYLESLKKSYDNPILENNDQFEVMHVLADFGEYYQSTWIKSEQVLCTVKYNASRKLLILTPDFTMFEPHIVKVTTDETRTIRYFIENATLDGVTQKELLREVDILNQVAQSKTKSKSKSTQLEWTETPHDNVNIHIFLEILSAWDFENDNIFIRYYIDLTDAWILVNRQDREAHKLLTGVTMASARVNGENGRHHFGFPIDVAIASKYGDITSNQSDAHDEPVIYFEVISKDTWCRYRCEGLTHMVLPIWQHPFVTSDISTLRCFRLTSSGLSGELRRFFIGDCANYQDLMLLGPQKSQCTNRLATQTISTGCLQVRINIIHVTGKGHSSEGTKAAKGNCDSSKTSWACLRELRLRDKLRDPLLTKSVQDVVDAFKKARDAMLLARNAVLYE